MGKILSTLKNPLRNFNIEERAHKVISQTKPSAAPRHESDQKYFKHLMRGIENR